MHYSCSTIKRFRNNRNVDRIHNRNKTKCGNAHQRPFVTPTNVKVTFGPLTDLKSKGHFSLKKPFSLEKNERKQKLNAVGKNTRKL